METIVRADSATDTKGGGNIVLNVHAGQTVDFEKVASGREREPGRFGQSDGDIEEFLVGTRRKEPRDLLDPPACAALNAVVA